MKTEYIKCWVSYGDDGTSIYRYKVETTYFLGIIPIRTQWYECVKSEEIRKPYLPVAATIGEIDQMRRGIFAGYTYEYEAVDRKPYRLTKPYPNVKYSDMPE